MVSLFNFPQPENASLPIPVSPVPRVTEESFVQPENALLPIVFTLFPAVTVLTFVLPHSARAATDVT